MSEGPSFDEKVEVAKSKIMKSISEGQVLGDEHKKLANRRVTVNSGK
jgi:hypothetical protein